MQTAIRTEQLTKRYGDLVAVDGLNLTVQTGEVFGLLGPNGAGKTTTIAMLLGLIRPTSGRAELFGQAITNDLPAVLRNVGAMIEAPAFYPYLSGRANLQVLARMRGIADGRVDTVLATVGLSDRGRHRVRTYSQGMKQRLAIAAALLGEPRLILLDEPTNGLDPAGTVEMRQLIRTLSSNGTTVVLCSHLLSEVEQLCERIAILNKGRLVAEGTVTALLAAAGSRSLEEYFLAVTGSK
jgi:ABC-2 type transport system ATP-binding protein